MTTPTTTLEARLKAVLAEKSLLQHPFYVEWTEGTLPTAKLQEYARQYFHFEAAFPRFLSAIHARTESATVRQHLLENLWDEEYGPRNHLAPWLDFAKALGLDPEEVRAGAPNMQTTALVEHFHAASAGAPLAQALGTLYAYEGQVPGVAWEKIKGLKEHYAFEPDQFEFFTTHLVADVAHSGAEVAAIRETCEDEDALVGAVDAACDRLLGFLDGCYAAAADPVS
jgi:pyrroloquinoline-quinone synthase